MIDGQRISWKMRERATRGPEAVRMRVVDLGKMMWIECQENGMSLFWVLLGDGLGIGFVVC